MKNLYKRLMNNNYLYTCILKLLEFYPLLGCHLCTIYLKQDESYLLSSNTSQIKFNCGHNIPLWFHIRLQLIALTIRLLVVRLFKCPHMVFNCLHTTRLQKMFICTFHALWFTWLQMGLCLPVINTFSGCNVVASGLLTQTCYSGWIPLLACHILEHHILTNMVVMCRQMFMFFSFSKIFWL